MFPFNVPPNSTIERNIIAKGGPISKKLELVALTGVLKVGTEKIKLHQVFANVFNPVRQSNGSVGHNLAEIDEPVPQIPAPPVSESIKTVVPLLKPELHPQFVGEREASVVPYSACVFLHNQGSVSAKEVRVQISHTDDHTLAFESQAVWKQPVGSSGQLNPRDLETDKSIHPDERLGTFRMNFKAGIEKLAFDVRICALDQPTTKWHLEIARERLRNFEPIQFIPTT